MYINNPVFTIYVVHCVANLNVIPCACRAVIKQVRNIFLRLKFFFSDFFFSRKMSKIEEGKEKWTQDNVRAAFHEKETSITLFVIFVNAFRN